jgi:hypothetical protein
MVESPTCADVMAAPLALPARSPPAAASELVEEDEALPCACPLFAEVAVPVVVLEPVCVVATEIVMITLGPNCICSTPVVVWVAVSVPVLEEVV